MWGFWLIAAGIFFIVEIATVGFLIFWLGIGALFAMATSFLTDNIAIPGFVWEVYGYRNGNLVYSNSGTFNGYDDTTNNKIPIVTNYQLSEDNTEFIVYFWIDGSLTGNEVLGGAFSGYIGATSQQVTAELS